MGEDDSIPEWDLSPLVESTNPDDVKKDLDLALAEVQKLEGLNKDHIGKNTPQEICELLENIDATMPRFYQLYAYVRLLINSDTNNNVAKDLYEFAAKHMSKVQSVTTKIELNLANILQEHPELIDDPILSEYHHSLETLQKRGSYYLSEIEEQLIIKKDHYGIDAWQGLHVTLRSTREYEIKINDEYKKLGIMPLYNIAKNHSDRNIRKTASEVFHQGLIKDRIIWAFALKSIFGDHLYQTEARKYPDVLTQSLLDNDLERECLDVLIETMKNNSSLIHRYLKLKAKILKLPKLTGYDVNAPIDESDTEISWQDAKKLVVKAYSNFDPELESWINSIFEHKRIDAMSRPGKMDSAYSYPVYALQTSWINMDYQGSLNDVTTLAHEAGHALHAHLSINNQSWKNYYPGSALAETVSIFGELLLDEVLAKERNNKSDRINQLCNTLDRFRLMVFDMLERYIFESSVFTTLENNENLDADKLDSLWRSARFDVYRDVVDWIPGMEGWWALPIHHFMPRFRYYNYSYSFGQLLVYALYGLYKEQGGAFVPKIKRILSAGCSKSPKDLFTEIGLDLTDAKFWDIGFKQAESFVDELETLVE